MDGNKIKAILIDSTAQEVREIEIENKLEAYYAAIGCNTIDAVYPGELEGRDVVYVDDNGLLDGPQHFFHLAGFPTPLAGNGLVIGTDDEGESVDAATPVDQVRQGVMFKDLAQVRREYL
jgi:hypothetical protein